MLKRVYVHNYKSLQNFTLDLDCRSTLLIGKNGSGKTSVGKALCIIRDIGRGKMEIDDLLKPKDFSFYNVDLPMRFELHAQVGDATYVYSLVLEMPQGFFLPRVKEETLEYNERQVFTRELGQITFYHHEDREPVNFPLDWHKIGLPIVGDQARDDYIEKFRRYLGSMILISPVPSSILGNSDSKPNWVLNWDCKNYSAWLTTLLGNYPGVYTLMEKSLKDCMPDFSSFSNMAYGDTAKNREVIFRSGEKRFVADFDILSDGEKCMFVIASVLAEVLIAAENGHDRFVFWDEPDSFLSPWELISLIKSMRRNFNRAGQLVATSHNDSVIECFSPENIFRLSRASHLEPTRCELLQNVMAGSKESIASLIEDGEI